MATKKDDKLLETLAREDDKQITFNPLLQSLKSNDKKNLFSSNVTTAFIKTGFPLIDYYFGSVSNVHDELGRIVRQEPRIGQAAGTFNLLIGNSGSGKAQPVSEPIPTPKGWTTMGDLKVGDSVLGSNGKPVKVLGVFPQGDLMVYQIDLAEDSRGHQRTVFCTLEHLWYFGISTYNFSDIKFKLGTLKDMIDLSYDHSIYLPALSLCCRPGNDIYIDNINMNCLDTDIELLYVKNIMPHHTGPCLCIYVDSPDHLYVTRDFVLTHNTTLASQIAGNIIRQYKYANVIHFDCENRFDVSRAEIITQLPSSYFDSSIGERYLIRNGMVGLDTIQEMIVKTYVTKMKMKDQLIIDSGATDEFGKPIRIFEPTVVIIDSITTVLNETFSPESTREANEAEKMRSNTEGARDAKTLKGFFKDVLPLCKEANIIIYGINHINTNMSMGFIPVSRQQNYLKQDESIPGGKTMLYYPFNIIKLTAKPGDDFTEEGDGFSGMIVMVEPIKSSSNQSGNNSKGISFQMVFAQKYGFDSLRSLILYGRDHGIIEGNRNRLKFKDDDSFTFSFKGIHSEAKDKPIWDDIKKYIIPKLEEHLPFLDPSETTFDDRQLDY